MMKYSQAKPGRIFILRLEDGDILHEAVERFASVHGIQAATLIVLGGADEGSRLVVGPEQGRSQPIIPMGHVLTGVHEVTGVGTLFPNANGQPVLHMHIAGGREEKTVTGCVRRGVKVWHVMEVLLWELTETTAQRLPDPATGLEFLQA